MCKYQIVTYFGLSPHIKLEDSIDLYVISCFYSKTEPTENEIVDHKSFESPVKLNFNVSNETVHDIEIAAQNIDK